MRRFLVSVAGPFYPADASPSIPVTVSIVSRMRPALDRRVDRGKSARRAFGVISVYPLPAFSVFNVAHSPSFPL